MATYITGVSDYIPAAQPFAPDYNFLGNMLQNAQTKYDSNYQALSKTYGTLLNSPMLRDDNIKQRDDYFKMIDGDIKRISGMDLSLQQNVDAANQVFDSFYQNKDMVKDMVFTKEYQKQLQIGENYRNCIDQEKCGGKYWDEGAQALNYRADEFKKASKQDALTMDPGKFTPFINVQEKAMKYAKDLLGANGSGFGVQTVNWSQDGRYIITTKNGVNLQVPLEQLLINQYGKDQNIQDMYQTKAYVNRKSFVAANAATYGSEDAAEDEYFNQINTAVSAAQTQAQTAQDLLNTTSARKKVLEDQIKTKGSTGDDDLAHDYMAAGIDNAAAQESADHHAQTAQIANSIFDAGDNRAMKRMRVDALMARTSMNEELSNSADIVAAMTGSVDVKEDPYAKSYYDFSLDMSKMAQAHTYAKDEELYKTVLDLAKQKALTEYQNRGAVNDPANTVTHGTALGMSSGEGMDNENQDISNTITTATLGEQSATQNLFTGYANTLMGILNDPSKGMDERLLAKETLQKMAGKAERDASGNVTKSGFDPKTNTFVTANGESSTNPYAFFNENGDWRGLYARTKQQLEYNKSLPGHDDFYNGDGSKYLQDYAAQEQMLTVSSDVWKKNNTNVKAWALSNPSSGLDSSADKEAWNAMFTADGRLQTPEAFNKWYLANYPAKTGYTKEEIPAANERIAQMGGWLSADFLQSAQADGADKYEELKQLYTKIYNGGNSMGKDPKTGTSAALVQALQGTPEFGMMGGGKAVQMTDDYQFNSSMPASKGTRGLVTYLNEALSNENSLFDTGIAVGSGVVNNSADVKAMMTQLNTDIQSGKYGAKNPLTGQVRYLNQALSDPAVTALNVTPSQAWLKQYQGPKGEPTWADNLIAAGIMTNGATVYAPRAGATNDFTTARVSQPYDIILNHSDVNLSIPNGGNVKIGKRNPDGTVYVQGSIIGYDASGKPQTVTLDQTIFSSDTGGQNIVNGINVWLQEIQTANMRYLNNQPIDTKVYNPAHLNDIKTQLDQQAGDAAPAPDLNTLFLQQVQFGTQQMQQATQ